MTAKEEQRNTLGFKHFKLHSDSTLKSLTKDDLIEYIHMLYHNWKATDEFYYNLMENAKKAFDNLPLKFEELQEGMWVWDDGHKAFIEICGTFMDDEKEMINLRCAGEVFRIRFRTNRFYGKQKEEWA